MLLVISQTVHSLTIVGFADCGGGGGKGEAAEEAEVLTLLLVLLAGDVGEAREDAGFVLRPWGGGGRSDEGGDGTFRSSISAASFCSVALRSATKSAMRASKSLSSSSLRDSVIRGESAYLSRNDSDLLLSMYECILKKSAQCVNKLLTV